MLTALLADYPSEMGRGRSGGIIGLTAGLGALFALFVLLRIPLWVQSFINDARLAGQIMFWAVAALWAASALVLWLGLSRRAMNPSHVPVTQMLWEGLVAAKNPRIILAYLAGFSSRGDSIVITSFLSLWVTTYERERGAPVAEALAMAGVISGVAQTAALVAALFWGLLCDRFDRALTQTLAALVAGSAYGALFFLASPTGWAIYFVAVLVGVGEIGMIVCAQVRPFLIFHLSPSLSFRCSSLPRRLELHVAPSQVPLPLILIHLSLLPSPSPGTFGLLGSVAILATSQLGGYLFDAWRETAPFGLVALCNAVVFLFGLFCLILSLAQGWFSASLLPCSCSTSQASSPCGPPIAWPWPRPCCRP